MYLEGGGATLIGCKFFENSTEIGGGGAVFVVGTAATPTFVNCVFSGNWADGRHSGGAAILTDGGDVTLTNCTLTGNATGGEGGGILGDGHFAITNCILWGNVDKNGTGESSQLYYGSMDVNYSCVQGWTGDFGGVGNIGGYPLLTADGRLLPYSPCIDAGDNTAIPASVLTDLDGNPRIVNGTVDLGAFEFQSIPRVTINKEEEVVELEWEAFGDGQYTVQWTDDLVHGLWQDAPGTWPITNLIWSDIVSGDVMWRFYRVGSQGIYGDPVGFVKVFPVKEGLTMLSVPLVPADNRLNGVPGCIGDAIAAALSGGTGAADADTLWKWDANTQGYRKTYVLAGVGEVYDGKWWDDDTGNFSTMTLDAGECFWILKRTRPAQSQ
jgi:hypothetical protein